MIPRLREKYKNEIIKNLMTKLSLTNSHAVPKIEKVVINMGLGIDALDKKKLEACIKDVSSITGQCPVITRFKKSISNFKTRKGGNSGLKVTLRNHRMYEFLDRLVNIAIPRIRDFRGLESNSFDGNGNYSFGVKEQIIFPEINYDKIDKVRGLNITICTTAKNNDDALELLKQFNMPFKGSKKQ